MKTIMFELDQIDMICLIKGTGGPGDYSNTFNRVGQLAGFPNERWFWKDDVLNAMNLHQLHQLYIKLKKYKKK